MPSALQLLLVVLLIVLLFGRGRISSLMGEVAKGIKSFRSGMKEGENALQDDESDVIDVDKTNLKSDEKSDK
ncbi:MAG: twin-arginine translocase TatA/TatE family subunit [Parvibaculales bacterium]